jgi:hypothetical protein
MFLSYYVYIVNFKCILFIYGGTSPTDGMIYSKMINEDLCLAGSRTMHKLLRYKVYFQYLILNKVSVNTI